MCTIACLEESRDAAGRIVQRLRQLKRKGCCWCRVARNWPIPGAFESFAPREEPGVAVEDYRIEVDQLLKAEVEYFDTLRLQAGLGTKPSLFVVDPNDPYYRASPISERVENEERGRDESVRDVAVLVLDRPIQGEVAFVLSSWGAEFRHHDLTDVVLEVYLQWVKAVDDEILRNRPDADAQAGISPGLKRVVQSQDGQDIELPVKVSPEAVSVARRLLGQRLRRCFFRDFCWYEWHRAESVKWAAIRDIWNRLSDAERMDLCPGCWEALPNGRPGADRVRTAVRAIQALTGVHSAPDS